MQHLRSVPAWGLAAMVVMACLALMCTRMPFLFKVTGSRWLYDLAAYDAAARAVAHGHSPYNLDVLAQHADSVIHNVFAYVYTPVLGVLLQPTADWGMAILQPVWLLCSSVAAAALVLLVISPLPIAEHKVSPWSQSIALGHGAKAIALIGILPIHYTLLSGQMEVFTVLLLVAALRLHMGGQPVAAGVVLGVMLVLKHAALPILPLFLLVPPRTTVLYSAIAAVALAGVTVVLGYGPLWADFLTWSSAMSLVNAPTLGLDPYNPYNISLGSAFIRMGLRSNTWFVVPGVTVWAISMLALAWNARRGRLDTLQAFAVAALASVIALPFTWTHHLLYLAPACAAVAVGRVQDAAFRRTIYVLLVVMQLAPGMPLIRVVQTFGFDPVGGAHALTVALALAAVLAAMVLQLFTVQRIEPQLRPS